MTRKADASASQRLRAPLVPGPDHRYRTAERRARPSRSAWRRRGGGLRAPARGFELSTAAVVVATGRAQARPTARRASPAPSIVVGAVTSPTRRPTDHCGGGCKAARWQHAGWWGPDVAPPM